MDIRKIIKEEVKLFETNITTHAKDRIDARLQRMTANQDITQQESNTIQDNLNKITSYNFNPNRSYGVMLGKFKINPNSNLLTDFHGSGTYYEVNSLDNYDVVKDSTGNEFWVIIRGNRLITAFLRKTVQRQTANQPRDMGGLGVDVVIDYFDDYLKKLENEKNIQQQRETQKQKELSKIINVNGVKWVVDDKNNTVYQKNKPQNKVDINDIFDHFDEKTVEQIYNLI